MGSDIENVIDTLFDTILEIIQNNTLMDLNVLFVSYESE